MIPKKIHYCWFGGNPLPELAVKCIESWKRFLPDYEIIEWNESNYNVHKIPYISQAYEARKYAFVSDYARFDILYEHGGIYFDTDVEVIKDIASILNKGSFVGFETLGNVNTGLGMASLPGLPIFKEMLNTYVNETFLLSDNTFNLTTVVDRFSNILRKHGMTEENKIQRIEELYIYPIEYFCPKDIHTFDVNITDNTYTIHHFDGSWVTGSTGRLIQQKKWINLHIKNKYIKYVFINVCIVVKIVKDFFRTK